MISRRFVQFSSLAVAIYCAMTLAAQAQQVQSSDVSVDTDSGQITVGAPDQAIRKVFTPVLLTRLDESRWQETIVQTRPETIRHDDPREPLPAHLSVSPTIITGFDFPQGVNAVLAVRITTIIPEDDFGSNHEDGVLYSVGIAKSGLQSSFGYFYGGVKKTALGRVRTGFEVNLKLLNLDSERSQGYNGVSVGPEVALDLAAIRASVGLMKRFRKDEYGHPYFLTAGIGLSFGDLQHWISRY